MLITCEHASNHVPGPFDWPEEDDWLRETHWAFDLGAAKLSRAIAEHLGAVAVLYLVWSTQGAIKPKTWIQAGILTTMGLGGLIILLRTRAAS